MTRSATIMGRARVDRVCGIIRRKSRELII